MTNQLSTGQPLTGQPLTGQPPTGQPPTGQPLTGQPLTNQPQAHAHDMPAELAALLRQVVPRGGEFGHRQHVHLAFLAVRTHGKSAAITKISSWIRHIAAYERAPQKYNATMTIAWTEIVGHHVEADPAVADFGQFA